VTTLELGAEKAPSRVMAAELHAQEVLKGPPGTSDVTVQFFLPDDPIGYRTPPVGTGAISFSATRTKDMASQARTIRLLLGCPRRRPRAARSLTGWRHA